VQPLVVTTVLPVYQAQEKIQVLEAAAAVVFLAASIVQVAVVVRDLLFYNTPQLHQLIQ
jgi:hypothetical protein